MTTLVSGPALSGGGTGSCITAASVAMAPPSSYGGRPSTQQYSSAPSDHRSAGGPGASPLARSGEMYDGAPTSMPVEVMDGSPSTLAMPKSVSTTRLSSSAMITLDGLTSRCRMPAACAARRTSSTASPISAARRGGMGPSFLMMSASERPSISSITIHGLDPSSTTS